MRTVLFPVKNAVSQNIATTEHTNKKKKKNTKKQKQKYMQFKNKKLYLVYSSGTTHLGGTAVFTRDSTNNTSALSLHGTATLWLF